MISWKPLTSEQDLEELINESNQKTVLIFKHSTSCGISAIAKMRLEEYWDISESELQPYYLDLIRYRSLSNDIANRFSVYHESPQILLIQNGVSYHDASHFDISIDEIKEVMQGVRF